MAEAEERLADRWLEQYAVGPRYPELERSYTAEELREALEAAQRMLSKVKGP